MNHRIWLLRWLLLSSVIGSPGTLAGDRVLDIAQQTEASVSLTTQVGLLEDATRGLTIETARSAQFHHQRRASASFALGFTRSAYWFRLTLGNSSDRPLDRMLEVANPRISHVDVYLPNGQGGYRIWRTGADRPQTSKAYDNRNFVFPLHVAAHSQQEVYLRVESNTRLWAMSASVSVSHRCGAIPQARRRPCCNGPMPRCIGPRRKAVTG